MKILPTKKIRKISKKITSNILATNLGMIVKKGSTNKTFVAVTDLLSTNPVAGAKVTLHNLQQQPIAEMTTDAEGVVEIEEGHNAYFAVATKGQNTTYIKLNEGIECPAFVVADCTGHGVPGAILNILCSSLNKQSFTNHDVNSPD